MVVPPAALLQLRQGPSQAGAGTAGWASQRLGATALVVVAAAAASRMVVVSVERRQREAEEERGDGAIRRDSEIVTWVCSWEADLRGVGVARE